MSEDNIMYPFLKYSTMNINCMLVWLLMGSVITDFRFHGCCWIHALVDVIDRAWELRVKGILTARNDTGAVNHSPIIISSTSPIVRLQYGCSHTIQILGEGRGGGGEVFSCFHSVCTLELNS